MDIEKFCSQLVEAVDLAVGGSHGEGHYTSDEVILLVSEVAADLLEEQLSG